MTSKHPLGLDAPITESEATVRQRLLCKKLGVAYVPPALVATMKNGAVLKFTGDDADKIKSIGVPELSMGYQYQDCDYSAEDLYEHVAGAHFHIVNDTPRHPWLVGSAKQWATVAVIAALVIGGTTALLVQWPDHWALVTLPALHLAPL